MSKNTFEFEKFEKACKEMIHIILHICEQHRNRLISSVRGIVERSFGTLKQVYGLARASYRGLAKVEGELLLCAMAFNLKKALFLPVS